MHTKQTCEILRLPLKSCAPRHPKKPPTDQKVRSPGPTSNPPPPGPTPHILMQAALNRNNSSPITFWSRADNYDQTEIHLFLIFFPFFPVNSWIQNLPLWMLVRLWLQRLLLHLNCLRLALWRYGWKTRLRRRAGLRSSLLHFILWISAEL